MNFHTVKVWLSKLISNLVLMLFIILVPAVASGAVPFWAAVIVAAAGLVGLNAACGVLLKDQPTPGPRQPQPLRPNASSPFSALCGAAAPPDLAYPRCARVHMTGSPRVPRRTGIVVFLNLCYNSSRQGGDTMKKLLEVCVDSLASARAAQAGGADRLEFCSALAVGGLSPYPELLRQIKAECSLPVRCLMRPRAGDFLYTKDEIDLLCAQIHTLRDTGADGFVIGALTPDGTLDKPAMAQLLDACGDKPVTLHRCIDVSCDLAETYRDAATLGIDTILTSGGAASCRQGTAALAKMLALRNELQGPEVLIGAGVSAAVITELRAALPGARAFHLSGKKLVESGMRFRREGVPMGLPGLDEWHIQQTNADAVRAAKAALLQ